MADYLLFANCNMDGVSFKDTGFWGTTFINCSMRNVDFSGTKAVDIMMLDCELAGTEFPKEGWDPIDMDGKNIPSIAVHCGLDKTQQEHLEKYTHVKLFDDYSDPKNESPLGPFMCRELAGAPNIQI